MRKLYLCIDSIRECKKDELYEVQQIDEDIYVYDIKDKDFCVLHKKDLENHFISLISMDQAINIFISKIPNIKIHKAKRVFGSYACNTYCERYEYYIKINENTNILFTERSAYIVAKKGKKYILDSAIATIQSNSQKINGLSFVTNLIPDDIKDLIDTLEFLCK